MKEHQNKFDEKLSKQRNVACGLPVDAGLTDSKVRTGTTGQGSIHLSDPIKQLIDTKWQQVVTPVTNCTTYEEFRMHMNTNYR
jgi:hypothetical protein